MLKRCLDIPNNPNWDDNGGTWPEDVGGALEEILPGSKPYV